jgi:pimeloyl-ACP methyl ester carboxylesterase
VVLLHGVQSSRLTWWRIAEDLVDLGWEVHRLDLLAHGDRAGLGPKLLSMEALAADVVDQVPGPVDLLVGHSLGSIVALTALGLAPDYCTALVAEDPPGLAGPGSLDEVADRIVSVVEETRADPPAARRAALAENPGWSLVDAENSVQNRLKLDVKRVTALLRTDPWDLPALVAQCPIPVHLLIATRDSALLEPARTAVQDLLPDDQIHLIRGGHDLHRDRPGLWLHTFLELARPYLPRVTPAKRFDGLRGDGGA